MNYISIAHLIEAKAKSNPDFEVLTFEHNGDQVTRSYGQLWSRGQALAKGLATQGFESGSRVGVLLQNHPEFVEAMIACAILNVVFVPLDPRLKGEKLSFMLRNAGCRGVICGDYSLSNIAEALPGLPELVTVILVGEGTDSSALQGAEVVAIDSLYADGGDDLPIAVTEPTQAMQIMYTSGTTGDPKGIVLPHARFIGATGFGEILFGCKADDRPYTGLSLTHGNAQFVTLAPSLGMELGAVFSRKFTKSRLWDIVRRNQCTSFSLLGGMATAIYSEPARSDDADNPVRHVVSAGMSADIWETFRTRFGVEIIEFYGAMEGGLLVNPMGVGPVGSCGKPPATLKLRIVDENFDDVAVGEEGELMFAMVDDTPMQVSYLGLPEASAKKIHNGWLRTGDIVVADEDGWIFYRYRAGGGIRHNGDFISPAAVEKVIAEKDEVSDVFVWGVPAASGAPGEKDIVASVVFKDKNSSKASDLFAWCRQGLEANMVPTYIQIVDEIPKTASEKPQERFLKEYFEADKTSIFTESAQ